MIEIFSLLYSALKLFFLVVALPYFIYSRVYCFYVSRAFYVKQNITVSPESLPIIGDTFNAVVYWKISLNRKDNYNPAFRGWRDFIGPGCGTLVFFMNHRPFLNVHDLKVVQDLYTTQNKHFDKHPLVRNLTMELTGRSILFADSDEAWKQRRAALAPAFYKGKLIKMIELAKESMQGTLDRWMQKTNQSGDFVQLDLIDEVSLMFTRILLKCAMGESLDGVEIDYYIDGKLTKKSVPFSLRNTFNGCIERIAAPHVYLFNELASWHITPYERDLKANCHELRKLFRVMI